MDAKESVKVSKETSSIQARPNVVFVKANENSALPDVRFGFIFKPFHRIFTYLNDLIQFFVPEDLNPLARSGAIANFSFLLAVASGILLLFWYTPSLSFAYSSLEEMKGNVFTSQLVRSLHRYSSDVCLLFATIHGVQLFFARRFTGPRWLAWITGIFSTGLLWFIGWIGYWLVWDARAKAIAVESAEQLDIIPIFADPLSRSFLADETINTLLFFVIFFFHIVLPLVMGVALWLHITRLNRSKFLPRAPLAVLLFITFIGISFISPAVNAEPASMSKIQVSYTMDYFYLAPIYFLERLSSGVIWALLLGGGILIYSVPWTLGKKTPLVSEVDIEKCNACRTCFEDCPYNAISMVPRTDGKKWDSQPQIDPSLCVGCGICTASCSSSAIGITWLTAKNMRDKIDLWSKDLQTSGKSESQMLAFLCAESAGYDFKIDPNNGSCAKMEGYKVFQVPCAGWVHMSAVTHALHKGFAGVLINACKDGDCTYREGGEVTERRLIGKGSLVLKKDEQSTNIHYVKYSKNDAGKLVAGARQFRETKNGSLETKKKTTNFLALSSALVMLGVAFSLVYFVSDLRYFSYGQSDSKLIVSFKHPGGESLNCVERTKEELEKLPIHMRQVNSCERRRFPVRMRIAIDGQEISQKSYKPNGIWEDGSSIAIESFPVEVGSHNILVEISSQPGDAWEFKEEKAIEFIKGERKVILFNKLTGFQWY